MNFENNNGNVFKGIIIFICFVIFCFVGFTRLNEKKIAYREEKQQLMDEYNKQKEKEQATATEATEEVPTTEANLVNGNDNLNINTISNYDIASLSINLNGADCELPFSVNSMVNYGYFFRDISQDGYTYSQLNEFLQPQSYAESFIDAMSPNSQIINILIKNPYDTEEMMLNCDVYGVTAATTYYTGNEVEPTMVLSNGLYLGMTEGDMTKIMGTSDKAFYLEDNPNIKRYQWYQSLDGQNVNNILTCDILDGYVQMLSIEIE